jgi:hypothetical protein
MKALRFFTSANGARDFIKEFRSRINSVRQVLEAIRKVDQSDDRHDFVRQCMIHAEAFVEKSKNKKHQIVDKFRFSPMFVKSNQIFINFMALNIENYKKYHCTLAGEKVTINDIMGNFGIKKGDLVYHKKYQLGRVITEESVDADGKKTGIVTVFFACQERKLHTSDLDLVGVVASADKSDDGEVLGVIVDLGRKENGTVMVDRELLDTRVLELVPTMTMTSLLMSWFKNTHSQNETFAYEVMQQGGFDAAKDFIRRLGRTVTFVEDKFETEINASVNRLNELLSSTVDDLEVSGLIKDICAIEMTEAQIEEFSK